MKSFKFSKLNQRIYYLKLGGIPIPEIKKLDLSNSILKILKNLYLNDLGYDFVTIIPGKLNQLKILYKNNSHISHSVDRWYIKPPLSNEIFANMDVNWSEQRIY